MSDRGSNTPSLHDGSHYPSPFTRVLALGYYDGPTHGLVECGQDGPVYEFDLLAWDDETQDLRIFGLSPLPADAWEKLTTAYAREQTPHWPTWVPGWQEGMEPLTAQVLQEARPTEWVIATQNLLGEILAARAVRPGEMDVITDWPSFLHLAKEAPAVTWRPASDILPSGE